MRRCPSPRRGAAVLGIVLALLAYRSAEAGPAALFASVDASTLVVRGTVEHVTAYPTAKLEVFRVRIGRVLKGEVAAGETLDLAQEMLFPSTKPYFAEGVETLVLAIPLPNYTSFQSALPAGRYWRWTERLETAADVAGLTDPALTEGVARYLALRNDGEATADFFVSTLVGDHARLRQETLAALATRRDIPPLLDAGRLAPVAAWLRDATRPPTERAAVLLQLARRAAPGAADLARGLAAAEGPMQAVAIDALITLNEPPPTERLLALSRGRDEALRLVASRGLAKDGSPEAIGRLAEMLAEEPSPSVRLAIVQSIGRTQDPRVVGLLATELARSDRQITMAAAEGLVEQGSPEAVAALEKALTEGNENAQAASAFALKRMNRTDSDAILKRLEASHPDPKVRRLCKLALGESMHEH